MVTYINEFRSYLIGEIELPTSINEARVDDNYHSPIFPRSFKGKCKIEIFSREGENIPHFHITAINNKFSCCVQLFDNRFFVHGKHRDTLSKSDWKLLDLWLRDPNFKNISISNWNRAVELWSGAYRDVSLKFDTENQPDYTTIKPYKGE